MQDISRLVQSEMNIVSRRIRGMAMISRGIVPNLVISQRAVERIVNIAQGFIQDETGESMVGVVLPGENIEDMPTIYVLDTISPDEETTVRMTHTFQQGDDLQDEIIWWLQENWRLSRETGLDSIKKPFEAKWDTPLRYLGDWHKQPGYMIQPSGGDLMTALSWLDDLENQMEYLLVPIVTLGHPPTTAEVAVFTSVVDGGSIQDCNVTGTSWLTAIGGLLMLSGYTGDVTFENGAGQTANFNLALQDGQLNCPVMGSPPAAA